MLYKWEENEGIITLDRSVVRIIVAEAMQQFDGSMQFAAQYKGTVPGWLLKLSGGSESSSMDISMGKKGMIIRVFVVIRFGTSISKVTNQLMNEICKSVFQTTGISVEKISVMVAGLIFNKHVVKRKIEIRGKFN